MNQNINSNSGNLIPGIELDQLLVSQPVQASACFTEDTLARIHEACQDMVQDDAIDQLLQNQSVNASLSFSNKALSRIKEDRESDDISIESDDLLDELISYPVISASDDFANRALVKIHQEKQTPFKISLFPRLVKMSAVAAVFIACLIGLFWTHGRITNIGSNDVMVAGTKLTVVSASANQIDQLYISEEEESFTEEMLFLAENLDGANTLLDIESLEALVILLD